MDKNQIAVNIFNKLAKDYQDKFMDVSLYGSSFDFFCDMIQKQNPDVLEIACGPGNISNYVLNKRQDFKLLGIDLAPNMIALAKENNPTADFVVMDCRDISGIGKNFDAILCGFCLPYLTKKESLKLLGDSAGLLNPLGLFYLSTMGDNCSKSGWEKGSSGDEICMHYHEADYLISELKKNNFEILKLERQDYPSQNGSKVKDLIIIAQKPGIEN